MKELTQQQLQQLTVTVPVNSPVLCLVCTEQQGYPVMVTPGDRWRCPGCECNLLNGRGRGKCPSCGESRPAMRKRWTYVVDCKCVQAPAQLQADAVREAERKRYYEREHAREVAPRENASAARTEADACLALMPNRVCQAPADSLPNAFCGACERFAGRPPTPRPKTNLERPEWGDKSGWRDSKPMRDITVSAAPSQVLRPSSLSHQLDEATAEIEALL